MMFFLRDLIFTKLFFIIYITDITKVTSNVMRCVECNEGQFYCEDDCTCHDISYRCDGTIDCKDKSDEINCALKFGDEKSNLCGPSEFSCGGLFCIRLSDVCDNEDDCGDGEDELNCENQCSSDQFTCKNGQCVSLHSYCDGITNCGDGSDELSCPKYQICDSGETPCRDGTCIMDEWYCDGDPDCADLSDEESCGIRTILCTDSQFECVSTKICISIQQKCDGHADCSDSSDEKDCNILKCQPDEFICNNGECLKMQQVCNGVPDCSDSSDEKPALTCSKLPEANFTLCSFNNGNCEHQCRYTKDGRPECICKKGFRLLNQFSCVDIDECNEEGSCSQHCSNIVGGFICTCEDGYILQTDKKTCKADEPLTELLLTDRNEIKQIVPEKSRYKSIVKNLTNAIGLDYDINKNIVYWTDIELDIIMRSSINGSNSEEIISMGLETPSGIALDWIHELLFWTDSGTRRIEVSNLNGNNRKVLIWNSIEKPRSIAAHPHKSYIFWIDWGALPRLERATMDGSSRITLASRNLHWPNGLTVDYVTNQIFWTDAKFHVIERVNLDGSNRKAIVSRGLPHPYGISVFEDYVYWTDWKTKSVNRANKFTGIITKPISINFRQPMSVISFHPLRQKKGVNKCENSRCSHLCLPNPNGITCACPTGFAKINETNCEEGIDRFLIFATSKDVRRISLVDDKKLDVVLPIKNMKSIVGLDWYANNPGLLFWSDISTDQIYRSDWDGRNQEVIVSSSLDSPCGISVDWITEKLYWTDAGNNRIEVSLLDGSMRTILLHTNLDKPRGIAVHPQTGRLVFTDWGDTPRIEVVGMDGTQRKTIVSVRIRWPNDVTIDHISGRVYWTDALENMIESCYLDGGDRRVLVSNNRANIDQPFGITCDEENIYWTDWGLKKIISVDKVSGSNRRVLRDNLVNLMDVRYFHNNRPKIPNPCSLKNGGCSHLCLLSVNLNQERNISKIPYSCACPSGLTLRSDKRTCSTKMERYLAIARRSDIRIISLDVPYSVDVKLEIESSLVDVVDVAIDSVEDSIYFTDIGSKTIQKFQPNSNQTTKMIIEYGLETVEGVAIDPFSRLLYWTDFGHQWIGVSKLDGSSQRILINKDILKPRPIALHPSKGIMIWSDWTEKAKIERANMDGSDRSVIISKNIHWPNGVTIDTETDRVFWCDAKSEKIEMSDLYGNNRVVLIEEIKHAYSISYQNGSLYFSEWRSCDVISLKVSNPKHTKVLRRNMPSLMGISVSSRLQAKSSQCKNNNCSNLCLPKGETFICACPTGIRLSNDGVTCKNLPDKYLIFTTRNAIRRLSLDTDDYIDVILPFKNLKNTVALDYHYKYQRLFYTDIERGLMIASTLNGSSSVIVTSEQIKTAEGIAVDWVADHLYWTDTNFNSISVSHLDGRFKKTVINESLDEPRAIAVHPALGIMFWTDWGEIGKIEKSFLDGSGRKVIVSKSVGWPNGLTIDYENSKIFWVDAQDSSDHIETCEFDGSNRDVVIKNVPHGFSLSVLNGKLYWTDWTTSNVHTAINKSKLVTLYVGEKQQLMDIKTVSSSRQQGSNSCDVQHGYGGCRYLCLMQGPVSFTCVAPDKPVNESVYLVEPTTSSTKVLIQTTFEPTTQAVSEKETTLVGNTTTIVELNTTLNTTLNIETLKTDVDTKTTKSADVKQLIYTAAIAFVCVVVVVTLVGFIFLRKSKKSKERSIHFQNPTYSINNPQAVRLLNRESHDRRRDEDTNYVEEKTAEITKEEETSNLSSEDSSEVSSKQFEIEVTTESET